MSIRLFIVVIILQIFPLITSAENLHLPYLIGDGMVVQRDQPIPIWGWADPGSEIKIELAGKQQIAITNEKGEWQSTFPKRKAGGPFSLSIESGNEKYGFKNILAGDVWVCSGQSNMEFMLSEAETGKGDISNANDSFIHHFKVPRSWASSPQDKLQGGEWQISSPETAGSFTAVGYYFAKNVRSKVDVPIGLLHSSWGGSNIESWMASSLLGIDPSENEEYLASLEAKEAAEADELRKRISKWPGALSDDYLLANADWSAEKLDESDWVKIEVPALWEKQSYAGLDGVVWYRKMFNLRKEQANQDLEIGLARIDDHDITWINGNKIGETKIYNEVRTYTVPRKYLHAGKNTIAIRVLDTGGGGGIYSESDLLFLRGKGLNITLAGDWLFKIDKGSISPSSDRNHTPTALYNKMMHPLFHVPVKGVLWYQGESNANNAEQALAYKEQFKDMILDWRAKWQNENLPFYWVQLANFISGLDNESASPWAILRESQTETLALPHTGQAVIIDVGNPNDIHPRDKATVGERLARLALKNEYGEKQLVIRGPRFNKAKVKGNKIIVTMKTDVPLRIADGTELLGFELAGSDGKWYPALAKLQKNKIELQHQSVDNPTSLRYAWSDNPETANLCDASGLPAEPFRKLDL